MNRPDLIPHAQPTGPAYAPLRVHGVHSMLTGVDLPRVLLERAGGLGLPALALTDVDGMAGLVEFLEAAGRQAEGGVRVKPIVGVELSDAGDRPGRVIALVESAEGYRNLCRLISARQLGDDPGEVGDELPGAEAFDLLACVRRWHAGLVILGDHPRVLLGLSGTVPDERLFAAVSPAGLEKRGWAGGGASALRPSERRADRVREAGVEAPDDALHHSKVAPPAHATPAADMVAVAKTLGLATVAVPDVYVACEGQAHHHRTRVAVKHNALLCDLPESWCAEAPLHLLDGAELAQLFSDLENVEGPYPGTDALSRTLLIAERCGHAPELGTVHFPEVELGEAETPYSALAELAFDGARERYRPMHRAVLRRLERELEAIDDLGYSPYFLLVRRIADFAEERGIPFVGRGSAADSLVAYCLGLTDADPLRYRLPFERFLNPQRRDRPDIDLDFCWRRRDEVLEAVYEKFGARRTAMISTLNCFGLRAAFREVALVEGIPPVEVRRWTKYLPHAAPSASYDRAKLDGARGPGLPARLQKNHVAVALWSTPECREFPFEDERWGRVLDGAAALIDVPRHFGLHPGGVVVAPGAITDFAGCHRSAKGPVVVQLDKDAIEAVGLVKMDLLGNRALTVIDDCVKSLAERGIDVDLRNRPEDEPAVAEALLAGRTLACFQVESPGMRNLLQQMRASDMDAVIQAVALIRPGPAGCGMKDSFIRRAHGVEEAKAPHPMLDAVLAETYGIMLYQEDVMQTAVTLARMNLAQADELRRGFKKRIEDSGALERCFFEGCAGNGVDAKSAKACWDQIANFVSFSFCKAHAVTYGQLAWRTVWLKVHHPAAFLAAFLASHTGYYQSRVYIEEARRMGVPILGPDVNKSRLDYALERTRGGADGIRIGLLQVKGLSGALLERTLESRAADGAFLSLPDYLERVRPDTDEAASLIRTGAFDATDHTRAELLWRLHLWNTPARRVPRDVELGADRGPDGSLGESAAPRLDTRQGAGLDRGLLAACRKAPGQADSLFSGLPLEPRSARPSALDGASLASEGSPASSKSTTDGAESAAGTPPPAAIDAASNGGWGQTGLGLGSAALGPTQTRPLFAEPEAPALALPRMPDASAAERAHEELELLGLTVNLHPVQLFPRRELEPYERHRIACAALPAHVDRTVCVIGWLAASRRVRTADGQWMRFLTFEDETGLAEIVLFSGPYQRYGHVLVQRGPFLARGRVESSFGACTLHADMLR